MRKAGLVEAVQTPTGADLRYARTEALEVELARLIAAEHECCVPAAIMWELLTGTDELTVRVTTSEQVRERVEAQMIFDVLRGADDDLAP